MRWKIEILHANSKCQNTHFITSNRRARRIKFSQFMRIVFLFKNVDVTRERMTDESISALNVMYSIYRALVRAH